MRMCRATIRLFPWELKSMDEYSCSMPSGQTTWKMWSCNRSAYSIGVKCTICPMRGSVDNRMKLIGAQCPRCKKRDTLERFRLKDHWVVGQYIPHRDPDTVGIRWHEVELLPGPRPPNYNPPDWSNFQRWKTENAKCG